MTQSGTAATPAGRVGQRGRRTTIAMLGPAFVAAIAYVDPGNFATNIEAGSEFGYLLVWVVAGANVVAMAVQYLSAKLGVVTGRSLPEVCRDEYSFAVNVGLWLQAELVAMATDIAEILGAAIALDLLFGVPPLPAGLVSGAIALCLLHLQTLGYRRFEFAIAALLSIILAGFLYEALRIGPNARDTIHGLVPAFEGRRSMALAMGIVGATVMPHVIYLHSALTARRFVCRDDAERRRVLSYERLDVVVALGLAGFANLAMLTVAAGAFSAAPVTVDTLQSAHRGFADLVGGGAALAFAVALLASGLSASGVGTYAGQVVMAGFVRMYPPLALRRALTMVPALILLAAGVDTTHVLVLSQVALSFGIPFALVPLIMLTARRSIMGPFTNRAATTVALSIAAALIIAANLVLIVGQL